ncbi:MAG: class I SAM-dependent methyltransferase [Spirochaetota bacterium]|jgi:SAM-dependent methyltransferase|nr:class I SAM-dependent methyltransferase [Spirochaetota bacterium]
MRLEREENRAHWNALGAGYSEVWRTPSRQRISAQELSFIERNCPQLPGVYLDVGCGNGRILALHDRLAPPEARLTGVDIAEAMLAVCRGLNFSHPIQFLCADIAAGGLPEEAGGNFVFISAIRVLKYNSEWKAAVKALADRLAPGGVLVFTMPNKHSLNIFGRTAVKFYRTTKTELRALAGQSGLEVIVIRGFSRIPDILYTIPGRFMDWLLAAGEALLQLIFGKAFLQRELFIALRRR